MNAIGTQLRDPINSRLARWRGVWPFKQINGRRRGTREESRKGCYRPLFFFVKFAIFFKLSKLLRSKNWKWTNSDLEVLVHYQILESLENMLLLLQPLWVTVLPCWYTAKGNKNNRSAQAVQDEASLTPAATRANFSTALRP